MVIMLASSQASQLVKVVGLFLFLFIVLYTVSRSTREVTSEFVRQFKDQKATFIADFLDHDLIRFNGSGLEKLCASKEWDDSVVFQCEPMFGGVAGVRNSELNCIRLAIETRAARMILPAVIRRDDRDITKVIAMNKGPQEGIPPDYFFDVDFVKDVFAKHCPQMTVHGSLNELHDVPSLLNPVEMSTWHVFNLPRDFVNRTVMAHPERWDTRFRIALDKKGPPKEKRRYPLRVKLDLMTNTYPIHTDDEAIIDDFASLLRPRPDVLHLAASALFNLQKRFKLDLDPRHSGLGHDRKGGFVGIHLRTEVDAEALGHEPYVDQVAAYLDFILLDANATSSSSVVFLATGASNTDVEAFAHRAKDFDVVVVTKNDLLEGDDLATLRRMTYDQRAMVDHEIMSRASSVAGQSLSKFSFGLATRRARAYGQHGHGSVTLGKGRVRWKDEFTTLYGPREDMRDVRVLTTWP